MLLSAGEVYSLVMRQARFVVCLSFVGLFYGLCPDVASAFQDAEVGTEQEVAAESGSHVDDGHVAGHDSHDVDGHAYDPTHVNMSDKAEDPSEWRAEKAIATLIVFCCLLAGLAATAWKPIREGLEKREKSIASNIANAEKASQEAMARLQQYEAKLKAAGAEAQQILTEARKDAEVAGQRLIATAQEEAARQRERAVAEIESAKAIALRELAEKSTDVAMTLASRIVGREVKAGDHQAMIQDMLARLPRNN